MAAWTPSLRVANHRAAGVAPNFVETEVFERLDSESSGFLTLAEMEPVVAMSSNSKFLKFNLRHRVTTAIKCSGRPGGGLSLPEFAAVFREDKNKCVDNYYALIAVLEMDGCTSASPQKPKLQASKSMPPRFFPTATSHGGKTWRPKSENKVLQAADLEAKMQEAALAMNQAAALAMPQARGATFSQCNSSRHPQWRPKTTTTPTVEALESRLEKAFEVIASPSNSKTGGTTLACSSQGPESGRQAPRRSIVDASANTGAGSSGATPVKSKMTKGQFPAKSDKDGQETHRNRDDVRNEILDVLKGCGCLQQEDFDFKVRQHLHAILGNSGRVKLHEALVAVSEISAKKKRTDVRNWAAYIVKILQSFHNGASAADVEEEVAEGRGAKADEMQYAMAEIQRLHEELAAAKEEQARAAASPATRRASMGAMLAPETDSEDGEDEVDVQDEVDTFPAPPDSQSWEWPLSRHEKKVRVQLLERQIHAADRSALVKEVKQVRRASLASARNSCTPDDEKLAHLD